MTKTRLDALPLPKTLDLMVTDDAWIATILTTDFRSDEQAIAVYVVPMFPGTQPLFYVGVYDPHAPRHERRVRSINRFETLTDAVEFYEDQR